MSGGPTFVHDFLVESAKRDPEKCALVSGGERSTFAQVHEWSDKPLKKGSSRPARTRLQL